jgi:hypothetical protein
VADPEPELAVADPEAAGSRSSGETPYDCAGIRRARVRFPVRVSAVTADVVAAAHPEEPEPPEQSEQLLDALRAAEALDPETASTFERVVLQNTALTVAVRGVWVDTAARVARRFSLPAEELESLGMAPARELDGWIGPRERWVDRKGGACGDGRLLLHDRFFHGLRAFRPLRVGNRRVLVSQLVALDTEGQPHLTPVIGQIEIRRGLGPDAAACVVELSADALRSGAASGLRVRDVNDLGRSRFVGQVGARSVGCVACHDGHGPGDFEDVAAEERLPLRANRTAASLKLAEEVARPLFELYE